MTLDFIKQNLTATGFGLTIIVLTLFQITPIKINPWSAIARWIGKAINKEVIDKVDELTIEVQKNKKDNDEKWMSAKRKDILRFGDEIRHKENHSKEHFDQVLTDISDYELYCNTHPEFMNNVASATINLIKETYSKCLKNNNFL